jgi:hypothetical protein
MAGTEVAKKDTSGEVADISDEFRARYGRALVPDDATAELMAETFGDDEPGVRDLVHIKFPTGGATSWIVSKGGKNTLVDELQGVLVLQNPMRVFWSDPDPKNNPPECMSMDGKTPLDGGLYASNGARADQNPTGLCKNCPMAQWGSDLKGRAGQGCKERKLLFVIMEGAVLPTVVTVPPASLKVFKEFVYGLATDGIGYWAVEIGLGLTGATAKDGTDYAELKPRVIRTLSADETAAASDYKKMVKEWVANSPATMFVDNAPEGGVNLEDFDS